jgi:hypothetical protein
MMLVLSEESLDSNWARVLKTAGVVMPVIARKRSLMECGSPETRLTVSVIPSHLSPSSGTLVICMLACLILFHYS